MSDTTASSPELTTGEKLGLYGKAFASAVVSGLSAYITATGNGVSTAEWIAVVLAFLASLGLIWLVPQTPAWLASYGKALFAGLAAAGSALITGLLDGALSQTEVITAVIAFLIASGLTGVVSDAASSDPVDVEGHRVAIPRSVKQALVSGPVRTRRVGPVVVLDPVPVVLDPGPVGPNPNDVPPAPVV